MRGKRETAYHIIISSKAKTEPFMVMQLNTAAEFRDWREANRLQLDDAIFRKTGQLYGKMKNGKSCFIVKGKVVVPMDGVTL